MKVKILLAVCLAALLALNLSSLYAYPRLEQGKQEDSLKYLYDRGIAIGIEYLEKKKYAEAKFEFEKAKFLFPEHPESYLNLAIIQIHRYDYEEAREELNQAKERIPDNYPKEYIILYNLGLCSYQLENFAEAVDYFSQSLELKPGLSEAKNGLALAQQKINQEPRQLKISQITKSPYAAELDKISRSLKTPIKDNSILAANLLEEASKRFKNNETEEAIRLIQQSITLNPENPQAHYRLGVIYAYLNRFNQAVEYFEATIKNDPTFLKAYINLGGAYGKLKNYPQALKALKKALRIDKDNAKIYYNLGMVNAAIGKKNQAKKHFKKARSLARKNNDILLLQKIPKL